MTKYQREHKSQRYTESELCDVRRPYWQRAHRDWRFLAVVFLMLAAIAGYVMTGNLAWTLHGHALPLLDTNGK